MFVVTVDFHIHPGQMESFMPSMLANAQASLDLEENCLQFDVCIAANDANHVFLYEIYRTKEDFDAHLKMPHFLDFNTRTAPQIISKMVHTFNRIDS
ncbi:putative quinol monooxygenase [Variovorax sp. PCZ-1]|uniref:putative quinol monooxygenase n=1 Tax=Variovorax sp. PCZ-1 TaxID=2835533 RepID=UPI001BD15812|nr:putative quinol monooxygenase [Variovorax sp. PCZ-1]MBS7807478.1 antibiotic biosynthesis monooxygenase [Variovorax sp. PCZ-1]